MTKYYVDKTFSFQLDLGATYDLVWINICECLKEELGVEWKDAVFEKSRLLIHSPRITYIIFIFIVA